MEILRRKLEIDRLLSENFSEEYPEFQVSYNSWGHICLRFFHPEKPENDLLIVLTRQQSYHLINFVRRCFSLDP